MTALQAWEEINQTPTWACARRTRSRPGDQMPGLQPEAGAGGVATVLQVSNTIVSSTRCDRGPGRGPSPLHYSISPLHLFTFAGNIRVSSRRLLRDQCGFGAELGRSNEVRRMPSGFVSPFLRRCRPLAPRDLIS